MKKRLVYDGYVFTHVGGTSFRIERKRDQPVKRHRSEAELATTLEFKDKKPKQPGFLVAPTSVSDHRGGLGLYACRFFDAGSVLFEYPGITCDWKTYDWLNGYLAKGECDVDVLEKSAKIILVNKPPRAAPNWHKIYDSFCSYIFSGGDNVYVYWNVYDWTTGNIVCNKKEIFGLFVNEPNAYNTFLNQQSQEIQRSEANVRAITKNGRVHFVAKKKINAGDEILICYGPFYNRDYDINYSMDNCENWRMIGEFVEFDDTESGDSCTIKKDSNLDKLSKKMLEGYLQNMRSFKPKGELFVKDN